MITIKCSKWNCNYEAEFDHQHIAESAATMHAQLGVEHVVTGTRRAHGVGVPIILFIVTNNAEHPVTRHEVTKETYRIGGRK